MMVFRVIGIKEAMQKFKIASSVIESELNKELYRQVKKLRQDIYNSMKNTQKDSGRFKYLGKDGRYYKPSKPGFPPAIATGNLIKSMISRFDLPNKQATVTFNDSGFYINYLEEGTKNMLARPSVFPAADRLTVAEDVARMIKRIIDANW
jgi:hypothetical protein